jgi:hypothetical protein
MKTLTMKSALLTLAATCMYAASVQAQSIYLNQSTSPTVDPYNVGAICQYTGYTITTANSYYRSFKISDYISANYFDVDSVQFSVQLATSVNQVGQPVIINVYSQTGPTLNLASLTLLNSITGTIPDVASGGSAFTGNIPASIVGTGTIVVEINSPDGATDGHYFSIGTNSAGQSKPSYFYTPSAGCGTTDIVDISTISSPAPIDLLISVYGRGTSIAPPATPGAFTASTTPVCDNATAVTYTVPAVSGLTYNWIYTGTGIMLNSASSGTGNSIMLDFIPGATSGTLSVTAYNGTSNSPARSIAIIVNPSPNSPYIVQTDTILSSTDPATSYAWYRNNGAIPGATNATYTLNQSGNYFLQVSDGTCSAHSDTITIADAPDAFINPVNPVCLAANTHTYQAYTIPAIANASNYYWFYSGGGVNISSNSSNNVTLDFGPGATSGTLSVEYEYFTSNGFGSNTSVPRRLPISVSTLPVPTVSRGGNLLTATPGFASYAWYRNNLAITGATASTYQMTQDGSYFVMVTSANGCSGNSDTAQINDVTTAINNVSNTNLAFDLYPNPAQENVTLAIDNNLAGNTPASIIITDISGRTISVKEMKLSSGRQLISLNTTDLKAGIYLVNINMNDKKGTQKLVIVK